ncbi:hypothetical protein ECANGB1_2330 [Enterospora canceri]|uniref:Uncharacterized protein n=1 Tax=Enterospora canceri TaxID=1081671 RepID=A0A1Y1S8J2_9MICR|nr:hypothetical protein ECANGB1_2330 [Enterospora canceri]
MSYLQPINFVTCIFSEDVLEVMIIAILLATVYAGNSYLEQSPTTGESSTNKSKYYSTGYTVGYNYRPTSFSFSWRSGLLDENGEIEDEGVNKNDEDAHPDGYINANTPDPGQKFDFTQEKGGEAVFSELKNENSNLLHRFDD